MGVSGASVAGVAAGAATATVAVRAGAIHLPAALAARHFADVDAVVALVRDGAILLLPVRHARAGGLLLKRRNAAGDRVVILPDVLAAHGLEGWSAEALPAVWSEAEGALRISVPGVVGETAKIVCKSKEQ